MHSRIIQVSNEPISKENYIIPSDITTEEQNAFFIDYVDNCEEDAIVRLMKHHALLPEGCNINQEERSITLNNPTKMIWNLQQKIISQALELTNPEVSTSWVMAHIKGILECGMGPNCIFYWDYVGGLVYPTDFFIDLGLDIHKVYVGGILDYHF